MAAQVEPPLSDKEVVALFIDTLREPFYDKMIGSISSNFSDIVIIGERVESGMRNGKISRPSSGAANIKKPSNALGKKKEGEANAVTFHSPGKNHYQQAYNTPHMVYPHITTVSQPYHPTLPTSSSPSPPNQPYRTPPQNNQNQTLIHFDPFPMSYT